MISRKEIIDRANCAYADGDVGIGNLWMSLLGSLDLIESVRGTHNHTDPDQQDYDEHIEEMSLGGRPYRRG